MREHLIQYVSLLFAGAPDSEEMKQEILQNTLDRYDDLVSQGKTPEAAYRLAISGIGDINELLGSETHPVPYVQQTTTAVTEPLDTPLKKILRAVAVGLYILCPIPLIVLGIFESDMMSTIGLCGTLTLVAVATVLMILCRKKDTEDEDKKSSHTDTYVSPKQELRKSIRSVIRSIGLAVYLVLSFVTQAWFITWMVFPIIACIQGLVFACMDLKEAKEYEN